MNKDVSGYFRSNEKKDNDVSLVATSLKRSYGDNDWDSDESDDLIDEDQSKKSSDTRRTMPSVVPTRPKQSFISSHKMKYDKKRNCVWL